MSIFWIKIKATFIRTKLIRGHCGDLMRPQQFKAVIRTDQLMSWNFLCELGFF